MKVGDMQERAADGVEWGYVRVSTAGQTVDPQVDALVARGIPPERIVRDIASGAAQRPAQAELLERLQPGDTVVVWALDRWGRSMRHLVHTLHHLDQNNIALVSIRDGLDSSTPMGKMMMQFVGIMTEFELTMNHERTTAALAARRARGLPMGRPSSLAPEQVETIRHLADQGIAQAKIARSVGTSQKTVSRVLNDELINLPQPAENLFTSAQPANRKPGKPKRKAKA